MNLISAIKSYFGYFTLYAGGGGSKAPTEQRVTQTSIPDYAKPYVETALGKTAALTDINQNPYQPYQGQQVAGFSPLQQQGMQGIAGQQVAPQLQAATDLATRSGQGGLDSYSRSGQLQNQSLGYGAQGANLGILGGGMYGAQGMEYGAQGSQYGALGSQYGAQGSQYGALGSQYGAQGMQYGNQGANIGSLGVLASRQGFGAGAQYAGQATDPGAVGAYMSPYMQNAVDVQKQEAIRDYQKTMPALNAQAVRSGAFGGSRQAITEAEAQRNVNQQLANIQATGSQQAYDKAMQSMQFGSNLGLQGLQAGYQGLQTGMQGTAQGIQGAQAGMQGAGLGIQGAQAGMQGAGLGIQGAQAGMQGASIGLQGVNTQLAGTAQGMQGVQGAIGGGQYGLAGLGTAGQAASTLGALGQTQYGQQMGINQAQMQAGALQQAQEQRGLDIGFQQYQDQLNYPYKQLAFQSDMFRGLPLSNSAQTIYQNTGAMAPQLFGAGIAAYGASQRAKNGGTVKSYAEGGMATVDPSVPSSLGPQALSSRLSKLSDEQLMAYARTVKDAVALAEVRGEIQRRQEARAPQGQMPASTVAQSMAPEEQGQMQPQVLAGGGIVALRNGGNEKTEFQESIASQQSEVPRRDLENELLKDARHLDSFYGGILGSTRQRNEARSLIKDLQGAPIDALRSFKASGLTPAQQQSRIQYGADQGQPTNPAAAAAAISGAGQQIQAMDADSQVTTGQVSPQQLEEMASTANREELAQDVDSQVQATGTAPTSAPPGTVPGGIVPSRAPVAGAPAGQAPAGQAPTAPTGLTGIVPSSRAPAAMATGAIPIANPGDPMGFGAYKASVEDAAKLDPEQRAVLEDMRKRSERKMARAEKQEKNVMSETTIAMGVAMMGGFNLAHGVQLMAREGGKKYFESSAAASKAIEAADDAQGAFDQYQLSLKQGNKKVAADMYGKFHNSMAKIQAASIGAAASMANTAENAKARVQTAEDNRVARKQEFDINQTRLRNDMALRVAELEARRDDTKAQNAVNAYRGFQDTINRTEAQKNAAIKSALQPYASQYDTLSLTASNPKANAAAKQAFKTLQAQIDAARDKASKPFDLRILELETNSAKALGMSMLPSKSNIPTYDPATGDYK